MKNRLFLVSIFLYVSALAGQNSEYQRNGNTVLSGHARFQIFTPSMGRMEYSPTGRFTDETTVVVVSRNFPACAYDVKEEDGWLVISTEKLELKYRIGSGKFTDDNLELSWKESEIPHAWRPGQPDTSNLGGVAYSLDGVRRNKPPKFPPGILSRSGYFVLDDSKSPTWNSSTKWIEARKESDVQDWYWIVYLHDYPLALKEYSELAGKIPMVPRYVLGSWITDLNYEFLPGSAMVENHHDSEQNVKSLVERFREERIPLDVLVLDFAWHKYGWAGGYDWSPIFPDPKEFLDWSHANGIKVSLNDHPGYAAEGVLSEEDSHAKRVVQALDIKQPPQSTFNVDLSKGWKFRTDTGNVGIDEQWYAADCPDSSWSTIQAGIDWEEQGFPGYDGIGWYRKHIAYPAVSEGTPILLMFGGVDDEYDLYVNGTKTAHYGSQGSSIWSSLTSTDITRLLKKNSMNVIALRVNDWGGGGGISKLPVALSDRTPFEGIRFNLADKKQADVFMDVLHNPLVDQGVDFWWIDGGRGSSSMEGLDGQMWTNRVYYDMTQAHTGKRTFIFSRYGGWGNHRYPGIFTGDTYSEWDILYYEVLYSAQAGNVLMPYVTHDIGGFLGRTIPFDLYARWIQFGVFNPLLRLHSAFENPKDGNLRMPWVYGKEGIDLVRKFFDLRYRLLPYIYTCTRSAYDDAIPLNRPLYLEYPDLGAAYNHPDEYFFGKEFLCAPILDSTGERDVYLPPGKWFDYFSGKIVDGNQTIHTRHPLETFPLFVRDGAIIPTRPGLMFSDERPLDTLNVDIYGTAPGTFTLYEDDGVSLDYERDRYSLTKLASRSLKSGAHQITIAPTEGKFVGQKPIRTFVLHLHGFAEPRNVSIDGGSIERRHGNGLSWDWSNADSIVTIRLNAQSIRKGYRIDLE
jgi:alpha-glucosidase (family GH31 glycosyl hydrolase)